MRERIGFAGAGAGNDQQWRDLIEITASMFDCAAWFGLRAARYVALTAFEPPHVLLPPSKALFRRISLLLQLVSL